MRSETDEYLLRSLGLYLKDAADWADAYDWKLCQIERRLGIVPLCNNPFKPLLKEWIENGWIAGGESKERLSKQGSMI